MNVSPLQRRFIIKQRIYSISVVLSRLILFLGFIGIWEFTADKGIINAFIFSSPVRLYQTFMDLAKDGVIFIQGCRTSGGCPLCTDRSEADWH